MKQVIGLFLAALGAILRYAIDDNWDAADMGAIGLILIIIGGIAFLTDVLLELSKRRLGGPIPAASLQPPASPPPAAPQQPPKPPAQA
jgi:hypothetical protein